MNNIIVSAGGIISRVLKNKLELLLITAKDGGLTIPKGHVEHGESLEQTAVRELKEEIGVSNVKIVSFLGEITRDGTEPNGDVSRKRIYFFLMSGSNYTYIHEEDFVWIEFNRAMRLMKWREEGKLLESKKRELRKNISNYFTQADVSSLWDTQNELYDDKKRSPFVTESYDVMGDTLNKIPFGGIVFEVGIGIGRDSLVFARERKAQIFGVDISSSAIKRLNKNFKDQGFKHLLTSKVLDVGNIIQLDIPDGINVFFSRFALNLSDTKSFFFLNEIIKKMPIGGYIVIEGKSEKDYKIKKGIKLGPHIYQDTRGLIIRTWDKVYVNTYLVHKLKLKLISFKMGKYTLEKNVAHSVYIVLKKVQEYSY